VFFLQVECLLLCLGWYSDHPVSTPGPSGYEQHPDKKAKFRHSRLHIPDRLPDKYLGKNDFMQERVDGKSRYAYCLGQRRTVTEA